jgi:uncharacterized protein
VDVGVHQDGLVHISVLANRFVKDPREVVKAGDIVKVKVMEVDVQRKRISLSMRLDDSSSERRQKPAKPSRGETANRSGPGRQRTSPQKPATAGAMADAFARATNKKT